VWKDAKAVLTGSILRLFDRLTAQDEQTNSREFLTIHVDMLYSLLKGLNHDAN
jgi:hypothetical protein